MSIVTLPDPVDPGSHSTGRVRPRLPRGLVAVAYAVTVLAVVLAFSVPLLAGHDATAVNPARRFASPGDGTLLGTDHLGRDLGVMSAIGLRTSLLISLLVVAISCTVGWTLGATSAYLGGFVDNLLGRIMDLFNAFPGLILAIALVTVLGPSFGAIVLVLFLATWVNYARVIRARVLALRREEHVTASRMYGTSMPRILGRHIWPNTADLVLSISLVQIPNVMLAESTISFLGFGLQPPNVSLGLLIATEKDYLQTNGLPVLFAGGILVLVCASIATVGLDIRKRWQ